MPPKLELSYYGARSSCFGVIDLAGFPKDRFYRYRSHWRPDHPMAHILQHWTWPEREGEVTPVHVFMSRDEAELFLNGESLALRHARHARSRRVQGWGEDGRESSATRSAVTHTASSAGLADVKVEIRAGK